MVENPGPDSTCTRPPSWSVDTSRGTRRPATVSAFACRPSTSVLIACVPALLRPARNTDPTWYWRISWIFSWSGFDGVTAPMKS